VHVCERAACEIMCLRVSVCSKRGCVWGGEGDTVKVHHRHHCTTDDESYHESWHRCQQSSSSHACLSPCLVPTHRACREEA